VHIVYGVVDWHVVADMMVDGVIMCVLVMCLRGGVVGVARDSDVIVVVVGSVGVGVLIREYVDMYVVGCGGCIDYVDVAYGGVYVYVDCDVRRVALIMNGVVIGVVVAGGVGGVGVVVSGMVCCCPWLWWLCGW